MTRHDCSPATCRFFSFLLLLFPCIFSSQVQANQLTTQVQIVKNIYDTIRLHMSPYKTLNTTTAYPCNWWEVTCNFDTSLRVLGLSFPDLGIAFNNSTALSSFFSLICSLGTLEFLNLSSNHLTTLPGVFFSSCTGLITLDLSQNSLSGEVPPQFSNLTNLLSLYLNGNNINGSIPSSFENMNRLCDLQLGENKLSGTILIPPKIQTLNLSRNSFGGLILSSTFDDSFNLRILDLSHNNLSGSVPKSLTLLPNLYFLDLSYNNLSGELPTFGNLVNLVITGNNFFLSQTTIDSNSKSGSETSTVGSEISTVSLVILVGSFVNGMVASFSLVLVITTCLKKPEGTDSDGSHPQGTTRPSVETPSLDRYLELYQRWQRAARVEASDHNTHGMIQRLALYDL